MRFQFHIYKTLVSSARIKESEIDFLTKQMGVMQGLCENHNSALQDFVGEDVVKDDKDDKDEEEEEDQIGGPDNLVQWVCETLRVTLDDMEEGQKWQVSMIRREPYHIMLKQLFDTATEIVQGPHA